MEKHHGISFPTFHHQVLVYGIIFDCLFLYYVLMMELKRQKLSTSSVFSLLLLRVVASLVFFVFKFTPIFLLWDIAFGLVFNLLNKAWLFSSTPYNGLSFHFILNFSSHFLHPALTLLKDMAWRRVRWDIQRKRARGKDWQKISFFLAVLSECLKKQHTK